MPWHAIINKADGALVSVATVVASRLPANLEAIVLTRAIDWSTEMWDPSTRSTVPKPADLPDLDRVDDFITRASFLDARLTVAQRTQFRNLLGTFLGKQRFRSSADQVDL